MLTIFKEDGTFKTPVWGYRSHGSEFLIYVTDFTAAKWEDIYVHRIAILTVRPQHPREMMLELRDLMIAEGLDAEYKLIGVTV
jgi:hypothetical protein